MPLHPQKKQPNRWLSLLGMGLQMGLTIFIFIKLGKWADNHYKLEKWGTILGTFLGLIVAFYWVNRQLQNLNK